MAVFKRGGVYYFNFWWNGKHVQRTTKQGNKRIAEQMESAYKTSLAKNQVGIHERKVAPAFKKALEDFLEWSRQHHQAHPLTYKRYKTSSVALLEYFGGVNLDAITPEDVEKFKTRRSKQSKTITRGPRGKKIKVKTTDIVRPATVNRELACLKAVFNHVIKGNDDLKNPVRKVKFLDEDNEQMRVLTPEEEKKYLGECSQPLKDVATLMLETGMRPEEVYRIRALNVNQEKGYLFNPFGKTKAARRKIPLTNTAKEIIDSRMLKAESSYLFPSPDSPDKPVLKLNNAHYGAIKRSKVAHFRLYDLRHTWATRAAELGVDLVTLAAMLGHSRIQMVLRYAHPSEQHQHEAMRRIEKHNLEKGMAELERRQGNTGIN
jgi:integrase